MEQRIKSFDTPHKGIRNGLGQLILLTGKTDYSSLAEIEKLFQLANEIFTLLTVHAHDENDVTLSELEKKVPGSSNHDMEDHERIESQQSLLENLLNDILADARNGKDPALKGAEFYTALCNFTSMYFSHMSGEESETQELIWKNFTDEEIIGHRNMIISGLKPDVLLLWIKYIVPAQNPKERIGFLKGMKMNSPDDFFSSVVSVVKDNLTDEEFQSLENEIYSIPSKV